VRASRAGEDVAETVAEAVKKIQKIKTGRKKNAETITA